MISAWELAEGLKTLLDAEGSDPDALVAFEVVGPTLTPVLNRAVDISTLHLQPWSEEEEALDRGDMLAGTRSINVILQSPLENLTEEQCCKWMTAVKEMFREMEIDTSDGSWRWRRNESVTLYDTDAVKEKQQFLAIFRATFYNFQ